MSGVLFFVQVQQEGRLQRGDKVTVDGNPGTVALIVSPSEIQVDHPDGCRSHLTGLEFAGATLSAR